MKGGPTVIIGQKTPSMTSVWTIRAPTRSSSPISSPMRRRSAVRMPMLRCGPVPRRSAMQVGFAHRGARLLAYFAFASSFARSL